MVKRKHVRKLIDEFRNRHKTLSISQLCVENGFGRNWLTNVYKYDSEYVKDETYEDVKELLRRGEQNPLLYDRKEWTRRNK